MYGLGNATTDRGREYVPLFQQAGAESGLPFGLLMGIAEVESNFYADAVNTAQGSGAAGLMQVMPLHFAGLRWSAPTYAANSRGSGGSGWSNPLANIRAGAGILRDQLKWRGNDLRASLGGYGGHSNVRSSAAGAYVDDVLEAARGWGFIATDPSLSPPTASIAPIAPINFGTVRAAPSFTDSARSAAPWLALLAIAALVARRRR